LIKSTLKFKVEKYFPDLQVLWEILVELTFE